MRDRALHQLHLGGEERRFSDFMGGEERSG
jgi:hypothetical protein